MVENDNLNIEKHFNIEVILFQENSLNVFHPKMVLHSFRVRTVFKNEENYLTILKNLILVFKQKVENLFDLNLIRKNSD